MSNILSLESSLETFIHSARIESRNSFVLKVSPATIHHSLIQWWKRWIRNKRATFDYSSDDRSPTKRKVSKNFPNHTLFGNTSAVSCRTSALTINNKQNNKEHGNKAPPVIASNVDAKSLKDILTSHLSSHLRLQLCICFWRWLQGAANEKSLRKETSLIRPTTPPCRHNLETNLNTFESLLLASAVGERNC